jgi:hypothetical protein
MTAYLVHNLIQTRSLWQDHRVSTRFAAQGIADGSRWCCTLNKVYSQSTSVESSVPLFGPIFETELRIPISLLALIHYLLDSKIVRTIWIHPRTESIAPDF